MPVHRPSRPVVRRLATTLIALAVLALAIDRAIAIPLTGDEGSPPGLVGAVATDHLVVSEVMTGGASASDEFIELYNPTAAALALDGLEVVYVTSTGATVTRKAAWASGVSTVAAGGHVLVANEAGIFAGLADVTYAGGLAATGGSIALRVQSAATAIDAVGWGTAASTWLETRPAPAAPAGSSLERLPGGSSGSTQDTDDNLVDFGNQPVPEPQNSTAPPVPSATASATASSSPTASPIVSATPTVEPTPTPTPEPTAATATPTATPTPTSTPAQGTPTPMPTATPLPAITIAAARSMVDGSVVTVEGVTLTGSDFTDGGGYLADGSGAIAVLLDDGTFARGVLLRVTGTLDDRYAQRTIRSDAAGIAVIGPGTYPTPIEIATVEVGEPFEGGLVQISGTISSTATVLSTGIAFDVDDGSGATRVLVGSTTAIDTTAWVRGAELSLIGVVGQRDSSGSGTAGYRLQPRGPQDILSLTPASTPTPAPTATPSGSTSPSATPAASASPTTSPTPEPGATLDTVAEARTAEVGARVRIRGVVTAPSGLIAAGSAVVQDSTGGILIRLGDEAGSLALGQLVELDGTRSTKAGMATLRVTKPGLVLGSQPDPEPMRRATGALGEADEARLVIARGAVSTAVTKVGGGGISFAVDDGSGPIRVTIVPRSGIGTAQVVRGAWLEVRGVLGQETTGKEPLRGYRIWPRMVADARLISAPVAGSGGTTTCCRSAEAATEHLADGLNEEGGADGSPASPAGRAPVLSRPHPTLSPAAIGTARDEPGDGSPVKPPRGGGLVVSGMGLAAIAALAAWFGRRTRLDPPPADANERDADPGAPAPDSLPRLAVLRAEPAAARKERRILPPN